MADDKKTVPTWGFHPVKPAQIFHLKPGEDLPEGWADTPAAFTDEQEIAPSSEPDGNPALDAATARIRELEQVIEQGKAENAKLREELADADDEADAAAKQVKSLTEERDALQAKAEALAAENEQLRAGHVAKPKGGK